MVCAHLTNIVVRADQSPSDFDDTPLFSKPFLKGGSKILEILFHRRALKLSLSQAGLRGQSVSQVERLVRLALENLAGTKNPTREDLLFALGLSEQGDDALKRQLLTIFSKSELEMTRKDVIDAVNGLILMANRYGFNSSVLMACSTCVNDNLSKVGIRFTYEEISNPKISFILKNVIPANSRELLRFIRKGLTRNSLSFKSRQSFKMLKRSEEKNFALFLAISQYGDSSQRKLFNSIKKYSTRPDGQIEIFDEENGHKLWKLFGHDLSEKEYKGLGDLIDSVSEEANKKGEVNKKSAFYRYFKRKAEDDPSLKGHYETLKRKNCFF